ncbi:MAG: trigger factor [Xanthobacteraceae bacterium]|jgi:trigger factor
MQVTETLAEGLKREFRVVVPATDLDAKVNERLVEIKDKVRINGFRPGKVPVAHLKRLYGKSAMAEAIDAAVREATASIVADHGLKLAMEPKITLPTAENEVTELISGKVDLAYSVAMEILPKIELADFKSIELEKPVAEVTDAEVAGALDRIAEANRPFAPRAEGETAQSGDKLTVSFTGMIDGAPFEGGSGEDVAVVIGSGGFIPGFEEQLIGIAAGESRTVKSTFPASYQAAALAGKDAVFEVAAKSIEAPGPVATGDELAKSLGMESLQKLQEAVRERVAREHAAATRQKIKRALLDALDARHKFDLPPTLVEEEFASVWRTVLGDLESQGRSFGDEGTTEEAAKAEYRGIAERRVRLGLVIAEIGANNDIKVTDEEMNRALVEHARRYPGQEQQIWDFFRKTPAAAASLRAPIYEEKVVDFLLELVKVTEKKVSIEELTGEDEEETKVPA